tara:strand:+ start:1392 stop:1574 length:183 start_codon:yes stop_codon:yes gene_type:complete
MFFHFYNLIALIPNNSSLGSEYREAYPQSKLCKMHPNDSDLGAELRTLDCVEFEDITFPS